MAQPATTGTGAARAREQRPVAPFVTQLIQKHLDAFKDRVDSWAVATTRATSLDARLGVSDGGCERVC